MPPIVWKLDKATEHDVHVLRPSEIAGGPLPVLYLLQGQRNLPEECVEQGALKDALQQAGIDNLLLVMPLCVQERLLDTSKQKEPNVDVFLSRFQGVKQWAESTYNVDPARQGLLGISMGGKQALLVGLNDVATYSALGILSAKLDGKDDADYKAVVKRCPGLAGPQQLGAKPPLYFHYCGTGQNTDKGPDTEMRFYANNLMVCEKIAGPGSLRVGEGSRHSWHFWRLQLRNFLVELRAHWWPASGT